MDRDKKFFIAILVLVCLFFLSCAIVEMATIERLSIHESLIIKSIKDNMKTLKVINNIDLNSTNQKIDEILKILKSLQLVNKSINNKTHPIMANLHNFSDIEIRDNKLNNHDYKTD